MTKHSIEAVDECVSEYASYMLDQEFMVRCDCVRCVLGMVQMCVRCECAGMSVQVCVC